ncbi:MAG: hypothetical protein V5A46_04760 [Haloferacaceae archaeon]
MTSDATPPIPGRSHGLHVPEGTLLSSRVVTDLGVTLQRALETGLDGYVVVDPQETLLLDADTRGVITFSAGVPVFAYDVAGDARGTRALARLADSGPYRVDRYETDPEALGSLHDTDGAADFRVPPGAPAEQLARNAELAEETRRRTPDDRDDEEDEGDPLAAFLSDEERVEAIQAEARAEAERRAAEWGFDEELAGEE